MFHSARLRLTAWYLSIIMLISLLFSSIIYIGVNQELDRLNRMQRIRMQQEFNSLSRPLQEFIRNRQEQGLPLPDEMVQMFSTDLVEQARWRFLITLAALNLFILACAGLASYFLAGRTLRPIQLMMDEQKRFITDASHELRTPITALKTEIEVGLRNKKISLSDAKKLLNSNLEEANNLQSLSDRLIRMAQYQSPELEMTNIRQVVENAVKKTATVAKQKQITVNTQLIDQSLLLDKDSMVELLVILIDNAIKYSPEKTIVKITTRRHDHQLRVIVADQGPGIKIEDQPYVFERFYRGDKSRTRQQSHGYGLGLAIAKQIVDRHNGQIAIDNATVQGTTIEINLPIKKA